MNRRPNGGRASRWAPLATMLFAAAVLVFAASCGGASTPTTDAGVEASSAPVPTAEAAAAPDSDPTSAPADHSQDDDDHAHDADGNHLDDDADADSQISDTAADGYVALPECLGRDLAFALYADSLEMICDDEFLYIESDNLADHEMMVGITAWNEQVPLPQLFVGANSWAIPLSPAFNEDVTATTGQGPIAVAINGVMIFNPTQQSGVYTEQSDPNLIGELDYCGGHSGRGDDYHYHVSPVCLEADHVAVDQGFQGIIAYAMDGYPVYANSAIPVGAELDECGGLGTSADDYRYFASDEFPYMNGCFRGDYSMDLQPQAPPIRDAGTPRQTEITANFVDDQGVNHLEFVDDGVTGSITWIENADGCFDFEFIDDVSTGEVRLAETYCRSVAGQQANDPAPQGDGGPPPEGDGGPPPRTEDASGEQPDS